MFVDVLLLVRMKEEDHVQLPFISACTVAQSDRDVTEIFGIIK